MTERSSSTEDQNQAAARRSGTEGSNMTTPAQRAPYSAAVATFIVCDWLMKRPASDASWPPTPARAATRAQIHQELRKRIGESILDVVRDGLAGAGLMKVTELGSTWHEEVWELAPGFMGDGLLSPVEQVHEEFGVTDRASIEDKLWWRRQSSASASKPDDAA